MDPEVSFDDRLREQDELGGWIQRAWHNLCKLGKEKITTAVLEQRKANLDRYWESFLAGHRRLMRCKEAPTSAYAQHDVFLAVEEAYLNNSALFSQHITDRTRKVTVSEPPSTAQSVQPQPQLPKIELPTFSGDPLQWESFRDLFKSLVHDVPHLSKVKKLLYLKSSLIGEAAEVIQNTPITDAGYTGAWEDLELRYGNTRLLSFSHHRALFNCLPAKNHSASELKRLLDTFRQTIRAYSALNKPVQEWDKWFVFLLTQKLDKVTHMAWETSLTNSRDVPLFKMLSQFLENRIQALDAARMTEQRPLTSTSSDVPLKNKGASTVRKSTSASFAASSKPTQPRKCPSCAGSHGLGYCAKFRNLNPAKRKERASQLNVCFNCLNSSHDGGKCYLSHRCLACSGRHHTLLHEALALEISTTKKKDWTRPASDSDGPALLDGPTTANAHTLSASPRAVALLATAKVRLETPSGESIEVRALLDTGSDTSFVTSWVAQALKLPRRAVRVSISGVQEQQGGVATSEVNLIVRSRQTANFKLPVRALILRRLTALLPAHRVEAKSWPHLCGLPLADPDFGTPSRVDLLLGADVCGTLFQDGTRVGPEGSPTAKLTPFGWVLMGSTSSTTSASEASARNFHCRTEESTHELLQKFWELEEVRDPAPMSAEEERCERHFLGTHSRDSTGRYCVRLPFCRDPASTLMPSRSAAFKMLLNCERRLTSNASLSEKYASFMEEYLHLNHMQVVPEEARGSSYYLPHHAVVKRHDPAAKLRVVFNASCKTASGYSLNDCLSAGPKLQADLWLILSRWRLFRVVFTTDIIKMFRQIKVNLQDADWQRILWRPHPGASVQDFRLTTVTYGTACAPFLALRVLVQLAIDEGERFPLGAVAIQRHSYVDDILAGADDLDQALELKRQVISIFKAGGFDLSKWASNLPELQESADLDSRLFQESTGVSTLGVKWNPNNDTFSLRVATPADTAVKISKRSILSEVASLFDPLGWTSPVLIFAKILMQDLWILGVEWDQELPETIRTSWCAFRTSLSQLDSLSIPRWTSYSTDSTTAVELHGFCDASQRAYAAAVYLRVKNGDVTATSLLVAKTKVAPVKTESIPRLELCGAVLLSKLLIQVQKGLNLPASLTAWTDSSVTLHWIRGHASQWKPFVAHRVSSIQTHLPVENWRHVGSSDSPADLATRGITPSELLASELWWHGPLWLKEHPDHWPANSLGPGGLVETERRRATVYLHANQTEEDLLARFSTLSRLLQILSHCFRFAHLVRRQPCERGFVRAAERASALRAALRISQRNHFASELEQLQEGRELSKGSSLSSLRPFIDDEGLLRVGGRLSTAILPYDEKHPILVAKTCPLATLLVRDAHSRTLHGGPQLTKSLLSRKFWILHGGSLVRSCIKNCVRCARFSGRPAAQLMGQLPLDRTYPHRPFLHTGVDYAGPIMLRTSPGRGHKSYKGYISLFICLTTRAIHLEVVSDLTTSSFLAAFRRFVGRRGRCATMYSDNATVFRGADRELTRMFTNASNFYNEVAAALAKDATTWRFIPPYAPHFGGLWEAGVKSVKHHLRRVIGDSTLTFEEMTTLLCQIEACLNSRPLQALSEDPLDFSALTPGHFLVGEPTCIVPEPDPPFTNVTLLSRWRQINNMRSQFWRRWRYEYLQHLQQLTKWRRQSDNLEVGRLVLLRDDLQPPAKWSMGRIDTLHTGNDGRVRVVTVRTASGTVTRPIVKIVPLPVLSADVTSRVNEQ